NSRGQSLRRGIELFRRESGQAARVVGDTLHGVASPSRFFGSAEESVCSIRASPRSPWMIPSAPSRPCSRTSWWSARASPTSAATCGGIGGGTLPFLASPVADVADEAEALRKRGRPEEVGVGLHRVALGDAAAAHDAERLLLDRVHLLLRDDPLLLEYFVVAGVEPRLHPPDLVPERIHVDD